MKSFFVYITTNPKKSTLYTGMTNDLGYRLIEHYLNRGDNATFAGRFYCYNLIYFEKHHTAIGAIEREKEIKNWTRQKKEDLIATENSQWVFLNNEVIEWPPHPDITSRQ
jgi:putative endonuclease